MPPIDRLGIHRLVATGFGIGYIPKGGGTVAALVSCMAWYFAWRGGNEPFWLPLVITLGIFFVGVYSAGRVEAAWGKDSHRVVIDEIAGMWVTLLFVPVRWPYIMSGFLLFRLLDIAKPFYIRKMENLKGGWGVMMDDILAGVYANLLLQLAVVATSFVETP